MSAVSVRSAQRRRDIRNAYLLLAPALLLLLTVLGYPFAWEIRTSFTSLSPLQDGATSFVGLENYRQQLADRSSGEAAAVTVVYTGVTTAAKLALGLGFALLLARPFRGRALVFLAIFLPWAYPGERQRDRLVLDPEPSDHHRVRVLHGAHEVCRRRRSSAAGPGHS